MDSATGWLRSGRSDRRCDVEHRGYQRTARARPPVGAQQNGVACRGWREVQEAGRDLGREV